MSDSHSLDPRRHLEPEAMTRPLPGICCRFRWSWDEAIGLDVAVDPEGGTSRWSS